VHYDDLANNYPDSFSLKGFDLNDESVNFFFFFLVLLLFFNSIVQFMLLLPKDEKLSANLLFIADIKC
jgi:hypothetical protein